MIERAELSVQKPERLISKDYILIMVGSLGTAFCNFIFFAALPLYAKKVSGSEFVGGLMLTLYSVAALLSRPGAGIISDKFGRVRLLIGGAVICAVACALYGVTTSVVLLLAIRVLNGFGFGVHSTCAGAVAADVIPKSRMAEGIGYYSLYSTIASAFGPFVALLIVGNQDLENFQRLFFVAAGLCVMSVISDSLISYERKRRKSQIQQQAQTEEAVPQKAVEASSAPLPKTFLGFEYAVFLPVAVLILLFFAQSTTNTFLTLFASDRGLGNIGLYYTISAVGLFAARFLFSKIMDRRGPDIIVIPGMVILVLCIILIPFAKSTLLLDIIAIPMGLASGAVYPSINTMIFMRCSPQRRGTASAAYFVAIDIGFAVGGIVFGIVSHRFGYTAVYAIAAALTALALALYLKAVAQKRQPKEAE